MLAFLFRRLGQGLLVVAVMATLVFVGVYALGNPIDILISPEADQLEREQAIVRLGLDRPMWVQFAVFVKSALTRNPGISFVHGGPAVQLGIYKASLIARLAFAGRREALLQDFVRFARAKGLSRTRIVGVHVLKTILLPIVTVIGLELGSMIAFAVVTETVFAWPGMGKLLIDSIYRLDRPVIFAYLIVVVVMFVTINLLVDLICTLLDPRILLA